MKKKKNNKSKLKEVEPILPVSNPYQEEQIYRVNIQHIMMDALLVLFGYFLYDFIFSEKGIYTNLEFWQKLAIYNLVIIAISYYFGYLYYNFNLFYSPKVKKIFLWVFVITVLMINIYLIRLLVLAGFIFDSGNFYTTFTMFNVVISPLIAGAGYMAGEEENGHTKDIKDRFEPEILFSSLTTVAFLLLMSIGFMIYFVGLFDGQWWAAILSLVMGCTVAMFIMIIVYFILKGLEWIRVLKYIIIFVNNFLPFLIVTALIFWSGVAMNFMQSDFANETGKLSFAAIIFTMVVSGIIPFRIIMMFNPPWRIINIAVGIISMAFFIWSLTELLN